MRFALIDGVLSKLGILAYCAMMTVIYEIRFALGSVLVSTPCEEIAPFGKKYCMPP